MLLKFQWRTTIPLKRRLKCEIQILSPAVYAPKEQKSVLSPPPHSAPHRCCASRTFQSWELFLAVKMYTAAAGILILFFWLSNVFPNLDVEIHSLCTTGSCQLPVCAHMHSCVKTDQRKIECNLYSAKNIYTWLTVPWHCILWSRCEQFALWQFCSVWADFMIQSKLHDIQFILQVVQSTPQPIVMTVELQSQSALERSLVAAGILVPFH